MRDDTTGVMLVVVARDPIAQLEAQRAYFASDDHVRDEVAIWRDASPEDRLRELASISAANETMLARLDEAVLGRLRKMDTLPPDVEAILTRLRSAGR